MSDTKKKIGKYEIISTLGKGAMGVVYKARDPVIDRLVAIKTQHLDIPDDQNLRLGERFITEARAAGRLNHPNIVGLYDFGQDGDCSYIVMELASGYSLSDFVNRKRPISLDQIWDTILKILDGLQYAHESNIIHRDIKPANILRDESGSVKITDFGIAQVDTSNLTNTGLIIGTPRYMAPERIKGEKGDQRADIFACGVLLHELLTGQPAFQDANSASVIFKIISTELPPASELCPECPKEMDAVIAKAVAKDPEERFLEARDFAQGIQKVLDESTSVAIDDNDDKELDKTVVQRAPKMSPIESLSPVTRVVDSSATTEESELTPSNEESELTPSAEESELVLSTEESGPVLSTEDIEVASTTQEIEAASPDEESELLSVKNESDLTHPTEEDESLLPAEESELKPLTLERAPSLESESVPPEGNSALNDASSSADKGGINKWVWILPLMISIVVFVVWNSTRVSENDPDSEVLLPTDATEEPPGEVVTTLDEESVDKPVVKPESEQQDTKQPGMFSRIETGAIFSDCPGCPSMIVVPPGIWLLGSTFILEEQPIRPVEFSQPFAAAQFEISRGEFARFVSATKYNAMGCVTYENNEWLHREQRDWQSPGYVQDDSHPAVCISWNDATQYISWLSEMTGREYRLLSSSEWEYIARKGHAGKEVQNDSLKEICQVANVADITALVEYPGWNVHDCDDRYVHTAPVDSTGFVTNSLGISGLLGNVFEWVSDCWSAGYDGAPSDGSAHLTGDCATRILRGGSWFSQPDYVRFGFQNRFESNSRTSTFGFRVARDLHPDEVIPATGE